MKFNPGVKYDIYQHTDEQLQGAKTIVSLVYMSMCDPCRSTKPYVEELAREYGFPLVRINGDSWDQEHAGTNFPHLSVYHDCVATPPLIGAQTKARILSYLKRYGAIPE